MHQLICYPRPYKLKRKLSFSCPPAGSLFWLPARPQDASSLCPTCSSPWPTPFPTGGAWDTPWACPFHCIGQAEGREDASSISATRRQQQPSSQALGLTLWPQAGGALRSGEEIVQLGLEGAAVCLQATSMCFCHGDGNAAPDSSARCSPCP